MRAEGSEDYRLRACGLAALGTLGSSGATLSARPHASPLGALYVSCARHLVRRLIGPTLSWPLRRRERDTHACS